MSTPGVEDWADIHEHQPGNGVRVLVVTTDADDDPYIDTATWNTGGTGFLGLNRRRIRDVRYWRHLPQLPRVKP